MRRQELQVHIYDSVMVPAFQRMCTGTGEVVSSSHLSHNIYIDAVSAASLSTLIGTYLAVKLSLCKNPLICGSVVRHSGSHIIFESIESDFQDQEI